MILPHTLVLVGVLGFLGGFTARLIFHKNWGNIVTIVGCGFCLFGDYQLGYFVNPLSNPGGFGAVFAAAAVALVAALDYFAERQRRAAANESKGDCCDHE